MIRLRCNASTLSSKAWEKLATAMIALKHTKVAGANLSVYDWFVALHVGAWKLYWGTGAAAGIDGAHGGPAFLPWHREYLRRFELALQSVEPGVTIPYWNWGIGTAYDRGAPILSGALGPLGASGSGRSGFGSGEGNEVTRGFLAVAPDPDGNPLGWRIDERLNMPKSGPALRRQSTLNLRDSMADILSSPTYSEFYTELEIGPHNRIHQDIGGHMATMASPNDPLFWVHHAQIDHLWAIWQRTHSGPDHYNPKNSGGYGHRIDDLMWPWDGGQSQPGAHPLGLFDGVENELGSFASIDTVSPRDVLDHYELGYRYDDDLPRPTRMIVTSRNRPWVEHGTDLALDDTAILPPSNPMSNPMSNGECGSLVLLDDVPTLKFDDDVINARFDADAVTEPARLTETT